MKYKRKLPAARYFGCTDTLARQIDRMAGLEPEGLAEEYKLEWRGCNRKINSHNNDEYDRRKLANGKN